MGVNPAVGSETNSGQASSTSEDSWPGALGGNVEELDEEDQKYSVASPLHFLSQQNVSYLAVNTAVGLGTDPAQVARASAALRGLE